MTTEYSRFLSLSKPSGSFSDSHYKYIYFFQDFGLDKNYTYPYLKYPLKKAPFDGMVNIRDEFFTMDDEYVHWDSDSEDQSDVEDKKKVDSLVRLSIKRIYTNGFLGKVPKKRRKIKSDIDQAQYILDSMIDDESTSNSPGDKRDDDEIVNDETKTNGHGDDETENEDNTNNDDGANKNLEIFKIKTVLSEKYENDNQKNGLDDLDTNELIGEIDKQLEDNVSMKKSVINDFGVFD